MAKQAGRLIVVSARAPFVSEGSSISRAPGGLVSALLPLMHRARGTWIAAGNDQDANSSCPEDFRVISVAIPSDTRAAWYSGASTGGLWPLAHGFMERCRFRQHDARAYRQVNRRVADVVIATAPLRGTVWIHDYQLALVPQLVREQRSDLTLGFFWHVPWPAAEFFRALPWRKDLVEGILGADVVGLHVPRYVNAFAAALCDLGIAYDVDGGDLVVPATNHACRIVACPIGIDVETWSTLARSAEIQSKSAMWRAQLSGSRLLLAVDRFDYTKGIVERLEAFERLLESSVEARERATLVQIAVPSRESVVAYRALRERVERTVGRILGRFGTPIRRPIHLFARSYEAEDLAAFYLAADVAVVTPLRDGMNLVAFEFVATRSVPTGRLLLSELTGAADVFRGAWLVNPYDEDAFDAALANATLAVETNVDTKRMSKLRQIVGDTSLDRWTSNFMAHLEQATRPRVSDERRREVAARVCLVPSSILEGNARLEGLERAESRRRGV